VPSVVRKVCGRFVYIIQHAYCSVLREFFAGTKRKLRGPYQRRIAMSEERITRRDAIKRAAYITPVILTVVTAPSFASAGSGNVRDKKDNKENRDKHKNFKWKD
jgi:hypothetical protein